MMILLETLMTVKWIVTAFLLQSLHFSSTHAYPQSPSYTNVYQVEELQVVCKNPSIPEYFDYSVKLRNADAGQCPYLPLLRRDTADDDDYSCSETKPCKNGACCPKATGYCNYGPDACGTNGISPNDVCWSNCDAHAQCGRYADPVGSKCPLNVCCSEFGFCGMTPDFCSTGDTSTDGCQSDCDQPKSGGSNGNVQNRIVGYYEAWAHDRSCSGMNFQDIPVESLTHLNFAFGYITPDTFEIAPMDGLDESLFSDFTALKKRNGNLVATISLGGWSFNDNDTTTQPVYTDMVSTSANRQTFIANLFSFMRHYGFDGVDFDWEYPGAPDRGGHTDDGENYTQFFKELQAAIAGQPVKYTVSFTAPTSYWYLQWFDIKNMMEYVDFMNLMAYDLHGTWDANDPIGSHVLAHTNLTEISQSLDLMWRNDVPPAKINLGLGFYGRSFQLADPSCWQPGCLFKGGGSPGACTQNSGTLSYKEIMDIIETYNVSPYHDVVDAVKYITWNSDQWVSYDDQDTFQQKIKFVNDQGLGGLLIWAVDLDTNDLDALRGVLYPKTLQPFNTAAEDAGYWEGSSAGQCRVTDCGGKCIAGEVQVTSQPCGNPTFLTEHSDKKDSLLCCPIAAAPDPKNCQWHGTAPLCDGQCDPGQVAMESNKWGDGDYCNDGLKFYCCDIPEAKSIDCSWKDQCSGDDVLFTFAGTFLETIADFAQFFGLVGEALADALDEYDLQAEKQFCCSSEEAARWDNCAWAGTTGKGVYSCDDNHCATGTQVELTKSAYGGGQNCFPNLDRTRAFCCDAANGESFFLPVPLDYLFPNPPDQDSANPKFDLETDDTWGTGHVEGKDDPNDAAFKFYVITSPDDIQTTLDKRDGSHWELFDCIDTESEEEQTIRMVCTDISSNSNCNKIHQGHGVPGTILEMPEGCGPGKYAVAKNMALSANQDLPAHLVKRAELRTREVFDLTFDYDFTRVPRAEEQESQLRMDFSNEEGYWNSVVNQAGETKRKRTLEDFGGNHKRWLEEEWRDDVHFGGLSKKDLHERWFGSGVIEWLKQLVTTGTASVTEELNHSVDETITAIIVDAQWGPCPVGPAEAQANIKAEIEAHLQMDTSFGITIITTLDIPPDLSQSYLYFKNKGQITATFTLDAVASLTYSSGDKKLIGLDDFPGATFRVPGIVTVGPNLAVYGSLDAKFTVAGHLKSQVNFAKWETQQTYPQESGYEPEKIDDIDADGTQTLGVPTFDWSVSASGQVELHLKPTITFGVVFDDRWKVPKCAVDLVADGYVVFEATAATGGDTTTCPFTYGIYAGARVYAQLTAPTLFNWGGTTAVDIASAGPRYITSGGTCPAEETTTKRSLSLDSYPYENRDIDLGHVDAYNPDNSILQDTFDIENSLFTGDSSLSPVSGSLGYLEKRDNIVIGPLIVIPQKYLQCPGADENDNTTSIEPCELCYTVGESDDLVDATKHRRDGTDNSCPYLEPPQDARCSDSTNVKRAIFLPKTYSLAWTPGFTYDFSTYPSCSINDITGLPSKWWMPVNDRTRSCTPAIVRNNKDNNALTVAGISVGNFATDHVFEVQLISAFMNWLVGMGTNYNVGGRIPFPTGWTASTTLWAEQALGATDAPGSFTFAFGGSSVDFVTHCSEYLGGKSQAGQLAVLLADVNTPKGHWVRGDVVGVSQTNELQSTQSIRNSASVFQYLQNPTIQPRWTQPGNAVEAIAAAFDAAYPWGTGNGEPTRPAAPNGVTVWGLRTLWCYWIDHHLDKVEANVPSFITTGRTTLQYWINQGASINTARNFLANQMTAANGLATVAAMHFPRDLTRRLPGVVAGAAAITDSRYFMWGDTRNTAGGTAANAFGPLGL